MKLFLALILAVTAAFGETKSTWKGTITDSMCLGNHAMMKFKGGDDECVRECVRSNPTAYKYILYDGKNSYKLSDQRMPEQFAAKKVEVKGVLYEKTGVIKVESIQAAK
jgi:hypothetical protein